MTRQQAMIYLGIGENLFDTLIVGIVPYVPITPSAKGRRWDREDLDAWVAMQPKLISADAGQENDTCKNRLASKNAGRSGTSRKSSRSASEKSPFRNQLDAERSKRRRKYCSAAL
jgi:hypothetical protein